MYILAFLWHPEGFLQNSKPTELNSTLDKGFFCPVVTRKSLNRFFYSQNAATALKRKIKRKQNTFKLNKRRRNYRNLTSSTSLPLITIYKLHFFWYSYRQKRFVWPEKLYLRLETSPEALMHGIDYSKCFIYNF